MLSIIFLAIIQGITEFLPISSSAHLIVFRDIFLIGNSHITSDMSLAFDVALHFGTSLSVIVFFFKDFLSMFVNGIVRKDENDKMLWYIIISTIPAAFFGLLLEDIIDSAFRTNYYLIAFSLIIMGILLYIVDKCRKTNKSLKSMNYIDALIIGIFQVFSLIPGFSRSGVSITSSRLLNYNREDASIYSFYLSLPIVLGAVLIELLKIDLTILCEHMFTFIIGVLSSFITGLFSIRYLINYVKKNDYKIFLWYRLFLGIIIIILLKIR